MNELMVVSWKYYKIDIFPARDLVVFGISFHDKPVGTIVVEREVVIEEQELGGSVSTLPLSEQVETNTPSRAEPSPDITTFSNAAQDILSDTTTASQSESEVEVASSASSGIVAHDNITYNNILFNAYKPKGRYCKLVHGGKISNPDGVPMMRMFAAVKAFQDTFEQYSLLLQQSYLFAAVVIFIVTDINISPSPEQVADEMVPVVPIQSRDHGRRFCTWKGIPVTSSHTIKNSLKEVGPR